MMSRISLMWVCLAALAGVGGVVVAQAAQAAQAADDPAWYAGVGVGRTDVKKTSSWSQTVDGTLATRGTTSGTLIESHDTAWKLFGGYQFNENFAAEAGYHNLGQFKSTTIITAPAASTVAGKWDAYAGSLAAVGIYPVVKQLSVFGKAGLAISRLNADIPGQFTTSATRVQPLLGLGARFDFSKTFGMRAEFERFNNVGDGSTTGQTPINVWSLSAQVRF